MNLWSKLFGKDPKDYFLAFTPHASTWRVVSWNFDFKGWVVEMHHQEKKAIHWDQHEIRFQSDQHSLHKHKFKGHDQDLKLLMNLAIHSTLKFSLEDNQDFMLKPVAGATTMDMQNEGRALQWIQASFGTLTRALDRLKEDPSLLLTAAFFSGIAPDSGERVLRLIAFNLDIFYYLRDDFSLQIVVFDDKDQGHGNSKTPSFQQIIKVTKPQFYDEIVKLVHRLAVVGEIK